jgi:hypothetical protein
LFNPKTLHWLPNIDGGVFYKPSNIDGGVIKNASKTKVNQHNPFEKEPM